MLDALADEPGGRELLALCGGDADSALVGGAVRDLLLGRSPRELDVVVAAGAMDLAGSLASSLSLDRDADGWPVPVVVHDRFGTATVEWPDGRIDIAERRAESYSRPGALPEVRPGTVEEDLVRRDFTVNAIAVSLGGARRGELQAAEHALEDLQAGRLRVLHDQSFIDDPTRLLRLARYRARLGFEVEARTAGLAAQAIAADALATVTHARIGAELRLALGEVDALAALEAMDELGVFVALHPLLRFDAGLARAALALLATASAGGGETKSSRPDLLLLSVLLRSAIVAYDNSAGAAGVPAVTERAQADMYSLVSDLEFVASDRDQALADAMRADSVAARLAGARARSQVHEAASRVSPEGVALAGAWGEQRGGTLAGASDAARQWLSELRDVRLLITGTDLLAAGIPEGPQIGRRLHAALLCKLDGELDGAGREAELNAALAAAV